MTRAFAFVVSLLCLASPCLVAAGVPPVAAPPPLVILTETGSARDGLPVFAVHPEGERIAGQLNRGLTADLLRVYRLLQDKQHQMKATRIEPAYLLLSTRQGGFARYGFWLGDEKKDGVAYVDVHRDWKLSGEFGAIDQIFPHELSHAIFHQLGVEPSATSGANQVHAVGVRTDRYMAFNEGFAEHMQIMAVDHPGAAPETRALARAYELDDGSMRHLEAYRRELVARIAPGPRMRISFPLWYSNDERVLRYFAVKRNAFTRQPSIPARLLESRDPYPAYLIENIVPGVPNDELRPVTRLLATEGAVSALFHRWATEPVLQEARRDPAFYAAYGVSAGELSPLQNLYLKLFHVLELRAPSDARGLILGYREAFPDEAALLDDVVNDAFVGQSLEVPEEIWLANDSFRTGTTVFDQFRGSPRVHTFDLNAASLTDLTSVPGVSLELAKAIQAGTPFASIEDLRRVDGFDDALLRRMKEMAVAMETLRRMDEPDDISLPQILMPFAWRALFILALAALCAGAAHRFVRKRWITPQRKLRVALNGIGAALAGVIATWVLGVPIFAIAIVALLFGLPAAGWKLQRSHSVRLALATLASWVAAAIPGAFLAGAWF